jgi:transposase-like protein
MSAALLTLDATQARALTDRIKFGVEAVWEMVKQAYEQRAWLALGYQSWDDYCTREFGTSRLRLPREERAEVVASLRESGLSIRAIASATGTNRETIRQEIASGDKKLSPDPDEDALAEELIVAEQQLPPLPENEWMRSVGGQVVGPREHTADTARKDTP